MASKSWVYFIIGAVILVALGFLFLGDNSSTGNSPTPPGETPLWMTASLKDINTGEQYTIQELSAKPVLIESFAVWCPTCTRQQQETKKFHEAPGFSEEEVISVSLDTDPNEDEARVLKHTQDNGFTWIYSISPSDVTQSLIDDFGVSIINAPSVPMVLICPDGTITKLGSGIKKVDELKAAVATCGA